MSIPPKPPAVQPQYQDVLMARYETLVDDPTQLLHYFVVNNAYIKRINSKDLSYIKEEYQNYITKSIMSVFGTMGAVLATDKIVLPRVAPKFYVPSFRGGVWLFKYLVIPFFAYGLTKNYYGKKIESNIKGIVQKYNFNFEDFKRINRSLQSAQIRKQNN